MSDSNEVSTTGFQASSFAENPEPRCPCVLLLDRSGSMAGAAIEALNEGIHHFRRSILADPMAAKRVELAIVSFGPVDLVCDFTAVGDYTPPPLEADGDTPMGEAICLAVALVNNRKRFYRKNGVGFYRPWIFLITDGVPTDDYSEAIELVHGGEAQRQFMFFAVGVEDADFVPLKEISKRTPLKLNGIDFNGLFNWLSNSLSAVSRSQPNDEIPLVNPTAPDGWATVG